MRDCNAETCEGKVDCSELVFIAMKRADVKPPISLGSVEPVSELLYILKSVSVDNVPSSLGIGPSIDEEYKYIDIISSNRPISEGSRPLSELL